MKTAPVAEVEADFGGYLERCREDGPLVITRDGEPVGVLLTPRDDQHLEHLVADQRPRLQDILDASERSIAAGKGLTRDELWQAVERLRTEREKREA